MITAEQQAQMDAFLGNKKNTGQDWMSQVKKYTPAQEVEPAEKQGFIEKSVESQVERVKESVEAYKAGEQGRIETTFQVGGAVIGSAFAPFVEAASVAAEKTGVSKVLGAVFSPLAKGIGAVSDRVSDIEAVQKFAMSDRGKALERDIEAGLDYLAIIPVGKVAPVASKGVGALEKGAVSQLEKFSARQAEKASSKIGTQFEKAVRPAFTGSKKTAGGMARYMDKAKEAVGTIVKNKENLKFVDEFGDELTTKIPQSLAQFSDAITQTKNLIYKKYSDLAEKASETGVRVDLKTTASELEKVASSDVLKGFRPDIVKYAETRARALRELGTLSPDDVQEAVKIMNQSLDAFYRSPSFDTASKAWVDSMIVNNLRKDLDDVIINATDASYQALKNQYSALKTIEDDVVRRALVDARKNSKGLLDFTDVLSGGDVVAGIVSMNPAQFAKGVAQKSISSYFKKLNDPNNIIRKMFEAADEIGGEIKKIQGKKINLSKPKTPTTGLPNKQGGFLDLSKMFDDLAAAWGSPVTKAQNKLNQTEEILRQVKNMAKEGNANKIDISNAQKQVDFARKELLRAKRSTKGGYINPKEIADDFNTPAKAKITIESQALNDTTDIGRKVEYRGDVYTYVRQRGINGDQAVLKGTDGYTEISVPKSQVKILDDVAEGVETYGMAHRPSAAGSGFDLTDAGLMPDDFYQNPYNYVFGNRDAGEESIKAILKMRGKPDMDVTVYRASPVGELNTEDWITLSKKYAQQESVAENTPVHTFKVKAKDIQWAGDDINEFGYFPKD